MTITDATTAPGTTPGSGPGNSYVELATTTNFSFLAGASHPEELLTCAVGLGLAGLGVADRNSVAGVVRAHAALGDINRALAETGAPPLAFRYHAGCRLAFTDGTPDILAYPRHRAGWGRLCRLLTRGNRRAPKGECHLTRDDLAEHTEGLSLIVMPPVSGSEAGEPAGKKLAAALREAAGPAFVRLAAMMSYSGDDRRRLAVRAALASAARVPLVAVNDVLYHAPERRPLQDVLTCIRLHETLETAGRRLEANAERHLKPAAEMARLFRDHPGAVAETLRVSEELNFSLGELRYEYPDEIIEGFASPQEALVHFTYAGAAKRYPDGVPDKVRLAIAHEIALIGDLGYAPYFLTVFDIVRFARSQGILCQGRGSAANSSVCFCLGITEVDPDKSDLLFERFVSADRREPPDIDVDFEHERREEVIQYIYRRYGRERAGLAATVISYRARSAVREVGKVFGLSNDTLDALAGSIWGFGAEGLSHVDTGRAGIDRAAPGVARAFALAHEVAGFPRHLSQHVGGFVMTRGRLDELVPIQNAAMADRTVIEWDKDDLDTLGILKVDVLALGMLSCLGKAFGLLERHYDRPLTIAAIPPEDPAVYRMLCRADSLGVFQVESRAQMSMLPRLRPQKFYDLVIEVAIVRPGPIQGDMVHPYLRRRTGIETVSYPKAELEEVLGKTLGVPLFQEQAMRIAIVAAGFTPSEADRLRRAMATFRKVGTIGTFEAKMVEGMVANGYPRDFAARCFKQLEGFGEYGFPESHAASFALLVYASSWVKCRYPDVFCAALLNAQPLGFYAPAQIIRDAREHGIEIRPVDINLSTWDADLETRQSAVGNRQSRQCFPLPVLHGERAERIERSEIARVRGGIRTEQATSLSHPTPNPSPSRGGEQWSEPQRPPSPSWGGDGGGGRSCEEPIADCRLPIAVHPTLPPATLHPRNRDMAGDILSARAVRLGFREVNGLRQEAVEKIVTCRGQGYDSVRDLWLRTGLDRACLERLADADVFGSLGLSRRDALWAVKALGRTGDDGQDLPLFASADNQRRELDAHLPAMPPGEEVVNDYRFLRHSLKAHPVQFVRPMLDARRVTPSADLEGGPNGRRISVAGLVLVRQRPGSAKGVIFMTLEDEHGIANVIVWPKVFERDRPIVLGARFMIVHGRLQNEGGIIHVVAAAIEDQTPLLVALSENAVPIDPLVSADEARRPIGNRSTPHVDATSKRRQRVSQSTNQLDLLDATATALDVPARATAHALPKGRNFR